MYPVKTGNTTSFAQGKKTWMTMLLILQGGFGFIRLLHFLDALAGFWAGMIVVLGWYAQKKDMNVTLICFWGVANLLLMAADVLGAVGGVFLSLVKLKWVDILLLVAFPASDFIAAHFAWEIFKDHERSGGLLAPMFKSGEVSSSSRYPPTKARDVEEGKSFYGSASATDYGTAVPGDGYKFDSDPYAPSTRRTNEGCC
eukprot:TRINITY_DN50887_c0_g1_i1.p1 TRINITY_DN50887_c0_g1~~TRINITY_DN50887_c0_g1_i1.p1  ORF type:complete len:199 (+),score=34.00 TRINITY_DN50887_c0_g1_i1:96-692(+)